MILLVFISGGLNITTSSLLSAPWLQFFLQNACWVNCHKELSNRTPFVLVILSWSHYFGSSCHHWIQCSWPYSTKKVPGENAIVIILSHWAVPVLHAHFRRHGSLAHVQSVLCNFWQGGQHQLRLNKHREKLQLNQKTTESHPKSTNFHHACYLWIWL